MADQQNDKCLNCKHPLEKGDNYCPNCGQPNRARLTFKHLFHELGANIFAWDSRLFRTIKPLLIKPGMLARRYVQGERKRFVNPLRLFIFTNIIFFFVISNIGGGESDDYISTENIKLSLGDEEFEYSRDSIARVIENDQLDSLPEVKEIENSIERQTLKQLLYVQTYPDKYEKKLWKNYTVLTFILVFALGLILRIVFYPRGLRTIEHLVFSLYFHCFLFILIMLNEILSGIWSAAADWFAIATLITGFFYFTNGTRQFLELKWGRSIAFSLISTLLYAISFALVMLLTFFVTIFMI